MCPTFADELVGCEAHEYLETSGEIVGIDEVGDMLAQLAVSVGVEMVGCLIVCFSRST